MKHLQEISPVYAAPDLLVPREKLFRFDNTVDRYYFRFPDANTEIAYMGCTAAVSHILRKPEALTAYYAKNGQAAYLMTRIAAEYGTLMHILIGEFERDGRNLVFEEVAERAWRTACELGFAFVAEEWAYHMPRNMASWIAFTEEKEVDVLAVEYPVWSDRFSIATLCDIYCELTFNRKRVRAVINLKKGYTDAAKEDETKQFYPEHGVQLQIERIIWNECVPGLPLDMIFNWSPNNFTGMIPTFSLYNWTDKGPIPENVLIDYELPPLALRRDTFSPPKKTVIPTGRYGPGSTIAEAMKAVRIRM